MQESDLDFEDLAPVEISVKIGGKSYLLREASEDAAVKWRNALLKATRLGPEGKPVSIDGMADTEPLLVSLCLWQAIQNPDGSVTAGPGVDLKTIRGWPSRIVSKLFARAKEISGLEEQETEEVLRRRIEDAQKKLDGLRAEKNGATTAGSPTSD